MKEKYVFFDPEQIARLAFYEISSALFNAITSYNIRENVAYVYYGKDKFHEKYTGLNMDRYDIVDHIMIESFKHIPEDRLYRSREMISFTLAVANDKCPTCSNDDWKVWVIDVYLPHQCFGLTITLLGNKKWKTTEYSTIPMTATEYENDDLAKFVKKEVSSCVSHLYTGMIFPKSQSYEEDYYEG